MQITGFAAQGNIEGVRRLLDGMSTAGKEKILNSLLLTATDSLDAGIDMLQFLIENGAKPNSYTQFESPLGVAAKGGQLDKVRFLVEHGADVNHVRQYRYTALIDAVHGFEEMQQRPIIEYLLQMGANPNVESEYNESPLSVSVYFGHFEIVRLLLEAGADPPPLQWTPLMRAIVLDDLNAVEAELKKSPDLTIEDRRGLNAWHLALMFGNIKKAKLLLQHGAKHNSDDLFSTVSKDNPEMTKWLINMGADPNVRDEYQNTPLIEAATYGSTGCVRVLIEAGADIYATNHVSTQAIDVARNIEIVKLLVNAGADIDYVNGQGYTLLRSVTEHGNIQMIKDLLALGANPNATRSGETPLYTAVGLDNLEIVKLLLNAGADPNIQTMADGWFPLMRVKSVEVAQALIHAGADVLLKDYMVEKDVLQYVEEPLAAEVLIGAGAKVNPDSTTFGTPLIHAVRM